MNNFKHESPWLHYIQYKRKPYSLNRNTSANIAVVGAGIAGIATAYFLLKHTSIPKIVLLESGRAAHGASGHNGGFLATYFERSFRDLVSEFGLELAAQGQKEVDSAWELLDEILLHTQINIPIYKFTGYTGIQTLEQTLGFLEDNRLKAQAGLGLELLLIANNVDWLDKIPTRYQPFYALSSHEDILDLLQSKNSKYVALLQSQKGAANSAELCESLVSFLIDRYKNRFDIFEHTKVDQVILETNSAILRTANGFSLSVDKVVLCTNGFENFKIDNRAGEELDHKFHYLVRGIVGYMAGYLERSVVPPTEVSYLPAKKAYPRPDVYEDEAYFYLTRRPVKHHNEEHTLVCLGGPEELLEDSTSYKHDRKYPDFAIKQFNDFIEQTYQLKRRDKLEYQFLWHGLMGFTPNGVRLIGPEPYNPILYYNLGCNGVGLLPSIYGARKIARFIVGEKLKPSIFDPKR
jgi:glycine/D-amino acid oxidase-like deaminating enzyme